TIDLDKAYDCYQLSANNGNSLAWLKLTDQAELFLEHTKKDICQTCLQKMKLGFCQTCANKPFGENFLSSNNEEIDAIIKASQLNASPFGKIMEFLPYERFDNIEEIGKGGFGLVFKARWLDGGGIKSWNVQKLCWDRFD